MDELVASGINDQHLGLAFLDLANVVILKISRYLNRRHSSQVNQGFQAFTGLMTHLCAASDATARAVPHRRPCQKELHQHGNRTAEAANFLGSLIACISLVANSNSVAMTGPTPGTETIKSNSRAGGPVF